MQNRNAASFVLFTLLRRSDQMTNRPKTDLQGSVVSFSLQSSNMSFVLQKR